MSKSFLTSCPRCGNRTYEHLSTHSHCIECLYFDGESGSTARQTLSIQEAEKIIAHLESKQKKNSKVKESEIA